MCFEPSFWFLTTGDHNEAMRITPEPSAHVTDVLLELGDEAGNVVRLPVPNVLQAGDEVHGDLACEHLALQEVDANDINLALTLGTS